MELDRNSKFWLLMPLGSSVTCVLLAMGVEAIDGPRSPWVLLFALAFIVCGVASLVGAASVIYDFARQPAKLTIKNMLLTVLGLIPAVVVVVWFGAATGWLDG